jgi:Na+/H+-dicarboxylate symporter
MVQVTSQVGIGTIVGLSMFLVTVLLGLLMTVLFYFILLRFYVGTSIKKFMTDAKYTLLLGFSVSSSAAVMPLTLKTAEEKMNIRSSVSRFIIPIGVSLNMDGTAVFQAIATLFLAQVYGLELDFMSITIVIITTIMASIGTPSAPGAGVIVLGSVLSSIGIPVSAIALIIGVDRLLGMFRTAVNVMGDLVACQVFNKIEDKKNKI